MNKTGIFFYCPAGHRLNLKKDTINFGLSSGNIFGYCHQCKKEFNYFFPQIIREFKHTPCPRKHSKIKPLIPISQYDRLKITDKEKLIHKLRSEGWTFKALRNKFHRSLERMRQIESRTLRKIALKQNHLSKQNQLSVRTSNCLKEARVSLEEAKKMTDEQLLSWKNFGKMSLWEVRHA